MARQTFTAAFGRENSPFDFSDYIERAFSTAQMKKEMENPNSEFYFGNQGGVRVGYLKLNQGLAQTDLVEDGGLEIERIYVLPDLQNRGLGGQILGQAIAMARERSFPFIWLGVWEQNIQAIEFYRRHGFVFTGFHPFKLGNDDQTDWIMRLDL